jgi:hypothetical protein
LSREQNINLAAEGEVMLQREKMLNEWPDRDDYSKEILLIIQLALAILRTACGGTAISA